MLTSVVTPKSQGCSSRSKSRGSHHRSSERGFSLIEMLVVMSLAVILGGIAIINYREFDDPLTNGAAQLASFIKQVRAEAISSTSAYIVTPASNSRIITQFSATCTTPDPEVDDRVVLDLPPGATLSGIEWDFCFNSRGLPDSNIELQLEDVGGANRVVEVLLGGSVRIQ